MAERERHQDEAPEIAFVDPIEVSISADGNASALLRISSPNEDFAKKVINYLEDISGGKTERVDSPTDERSSGKSFGFGGTKWNALWDPKGPKPNWAEPTNPSKN